MNKPMISVIMPVFNCAKYIQQTIDSILSQTFKDFEVIIVNDGSTDNTGLIIKKNEDKRLKVINNKKNMGVTKSLNLALQNAKGEFIARCDGDDINTRKRFSIQVEFLSKNSDIILVGSNARIINEKGENIGYCLMPKTDQQIKRMLWMKNPFVHSTVMFKRKALEKIGKYNELFNGAEDYDLWFRLLKIGKAYNIQRALIQRRIHETGVTVKSRFKVELKALFVRIMHLNYLW